MPGGRLSPPFDGGVGANSGGSFSNGFSKPGPGGHSSGVSHENGIPHLTIVTPFFT